MSSTNIQTVNYSQQELRNRASHGSANTNSANTATSAKRSAEEVLIEKLDAFLSSIEHRLDRFDQYFKISGDVILEDVAGTEISAPGSQTRSRRSSSASLSSLKNFSMYNLNKVYEQLSMVKDQVLKTSVLNLEYLYKALDDKYNYLFKEDGDEGIEHLASFSGDYSFQAMDTAKNASGVSISQTVPESRPESRSQASRAETSGPSGPKPDSSTLASPEYQSPSSSYLDSIASNRELLTNKIITNLTYFEQKLSHIDALIKSRTPQATANYDEDAKFNRYRFFNFNRALKAAQKGYLHYYQLPLSWRENRYIIHGYRFNLSHREMLKSMFHFNHNESANIWTHVCGACVMCYLGLVHFPQTAVFAQNSRMGNAMMFIFILAALECLVSSVLWHTYSCFAQLKIRNRFACVDYTGITVLITCSVIAAEYCSLYNYPKLLYGFMAVSIASGLGGFLFNWSPYFDRPDCRPLRIGFFVSLAFLGATTFLCKWYYEGLVTSFYFYCPLLYKSFVWYWLGVVFYGGLIPERWRYDIIINEDDTCGHEHSASDVFKGNIEHSGEEELRDVQAEIASRCAHNGQYANRSCVSSSVSPVSSALPSAHSSTSSSTSTSESGSSSMPELGANTPVSIETEGHSHASDVVSVVSGPVASGGVDSRAPRATCTCASAALDDDTLQQNDILKKHFPESPMRTPYHRDFFSLWWVDYIFQSHNIWHVFVVLGVVGHYFCLLGMYEDVHLLQGHLAV